MQKNDQSPPGGKVVTLTEIASRLHDLGRRSPKLADAALLFTIPKNHTSFKNVLVFEGDTKISGDLIIDTNRKWLKKNQISMVVSFGDLHVEGDIINDDEHFWPVLAVDGTLSACNIVKGGMPLLVWKNLIVSGYMVPEFNDGPLRVGENFSALGYVPWCKDRPEGRGHVISGEFSGRMFDARNEFKGKDLRRVFIPEVLNHNWLNTSAVLQHGHEGKLIWRDKPLEEEEEVLEQIDLPEPNSVNPIELGTFRKANEVFDFVYEKIKTKIVHDPERYSYPESFAEYVRAQFKYYPQYQVLMLPAGTKIDGDLVIDWAEDWVEQNNICAIVCEGDLTVTGDVINKMLEGGVLLFVEGDLAVNNLIKGGATVMVLGSVCSRGLVVGEYNDGVLRIGGDLDAVAFFLLDHDGFVRGETRARKYTDDDGEWQDLLVSQVFTDEEEYHPNVDRLLAFHKAGREIFRTS